MQIVADEQLWFIVKRKETKQSLVIINENGKRYEYEGITSNQIRRLRILPEKGIAIDIVSPQAKISNEEVVNFSVFDYERGIIEEYSLPAKRLFSTRKNIVLKPK